MSQLQYPQSDSERRFLLGSLAENQTNAYLPPSFLDEILTINDSFQKQLDTIALLAYQHLMVVEQHQEGIKTLEIYVHAFQTEIILRSQQYEWAREGYVDFFDVESRSLEYTDTKELLKVAEELLAGEERAVAAGYLPMVKPSADDLDSKRQFVARGVHRINGAKADLEYAESMIVSLREQVDWLIQQASDYLDEVLQALPASEIYQIKCSYGFHFMGDG